MENSINKNIPLMFQKLNEYEVDDIRFLKVKIWLMHLGENLNGSYFSKNVVESAMPTLANTPILAYIEDNNGEDDFSDHRSILVIENNKVEIKYIGQAIGVIPETNNAQFEKRLCDDGIEREFLTVEGLVWTKWDTPIDIFNRDLIKSQSMELAEDYDGYFDKNDNLFHFTDFKFFGACALGKEVIPAMQNSTIEIQFSSNVIFKEIQGYMEKFKSFNLKNKVKSEVNLMEDNKNFALSIENFEKEVKKILRQRTITITDWWGDSYEENEFYYRDRKDNYIIVVSNDYSEYYGIPFVENGDSVTLDFESKVPFIHDWRQKEDGENFVNFAKEEIEAKLEYVKNKAMEKAKSEFNICETEEYKTLNKDFENLQLKLNEYSTVNKETGAESENEIATKFELLQKDYDELQTKLNNITSDFESIKQEKEKLEEVNSKFELEKRKAEVENILSDFSFTQEEVKDIKEKAISKEIDLEQFKAQCFMLEGIKTHEAKKSNKDFSLKQEETTRIKIADNSSDINPYGSAGIYFNK